MLIVQLVFRAVKTGSVSNVSEILTLILKMKAAVTSETLSIQPHPYGGNIQKQKQLQRDGFVKQHNRGVTVYFL
jgi:hypothetical protein